MTIFVNAALTVSKLKARFLEPYTSEVINRFFFTQGLIGIHYGFDIQPDPITGPLAVKLVHDTARGRSLAVIPDYTQRLGFAFDEDTEQVLDLAANAGTRVYIFLYVAYTTSGTPTEIRLRVADAAELVNPWVNSALLLGTVRVPSVGSLSIGHIDKGSAIYAGLLAGGARRWSQHTTNPEFNKGLSGFGIINGRVGAVDYVLPGFSGGAGNIVLGDLSGTAGAQGPHRVFVTVPDVKVDDVILVRFVTDAVSVANGATLNVVIGSGYDEVIVDANVASPEVFGVTYTATAADESLGVGLSLELPNVNSTARFTVRRFEVFRLRTDVALTGDQSSPDYMAARVLSFGAAAPLAGSSLAHEGGNNHPVLRIPTTGNNNLLTKPVRITEDDYTTPSLKEETDDGPSLLRAALQGTRAFGMMASLFPQAVIDGAALSVVLPDQVQLGSGVISSAAAATEADLYGAVADDAMLTPFDAAYNSFLTVSVPTTGNPVLVMWDGGEPDQTQRLIAIEAASVGSYPNATPLAWVEYDTGTNQITKLIDVRDKLINAQGKLTMYVGESSNNRARMSLEGALQLVGVFAGPSTLQGRPVARFEIVVSGYHTVARTLQLHSFVTIRGEAQGTGITGTQQARLLLAGGVTTMFTTGTASLQRVTFKDLDFVTTDVGCTAIMMEDNTSITDLRLENCRFRTLANSWQYCLRSTVTASGLLGRCLFDGCEFNYGDLTTSRAIWLRDQNLGALHLTVRRSTFDLASGVGDHIAVAGMRQRRDENNACVFEDVSFGALPPTNLPGIDLTARATIERCRLKCSVRFAEGNVTSAAEGIYRLIDCDLEQTGDTGGTAFTAISASGGTSAPFALHVSGCLVDAANVTGAGTRTGIRISSSGQPGKLFANNTHIKMPLGGGANILGIYGTGVGGSTQLYLDGVRLDGQEVAGGITTSWGIYLDPVADRGIMKGLHVRGFGDDLAVFFASGAAKNILSHLIVEQPSAGAGYTEVVPAANTIQTTTIVVN